MTTKLVAFCCRHAWLVTLVALLIGAAAAFYVSQNFEMNTKSEDLISPNVPWRKLEATYDSKFPQQNNLTLVVVDGVTPEITHAAVTALAAKLAERKDVFLNAHMETTDTFFSRNGLLFLPLPEVQETVQKIINAQAFLGGLAIDPSIRGVMDTLDTVLTGVDHDQAKLGDLSRPMTAISDTLDQVVQGKQAFLSWQSLITGRSPSREELRSFIDVQAKLDFSALEPGLKASEVIRQTARDLGLTPENGVRVRLTGPIPLADEEFGTLAERAVLMTSAMLITVLIVLWLAVKSFRIIFCIVATIGIGLAVTTAFGLIAVGVFNILSIAFIALFVGLGVDFGIQFSVRYRAERHAHDNIDRALISAGRTLGRPLGLAAAATAAGFFSFLPTDYVGVAELGLIAGVGMVIAFLGSITILPALLRLTRPGPEKDDVGFTFLAPLDDLVTNHRGPVLLSLGAIGLASLVLVPQLRFDSNPLDLRSAKTESVSTILDLAKDPMTSPNAINVLAPSLAAAKPIADKLSDLPEVNQVLSPYTFVPEDQDAKLAIIQDAASLLDTTLDPFGTKPPPSDTENIAALKQTAKHLRATASADKSQAASQAIHLADTLDKLADGNAAMRRHANLALVPGLKGLLDQLTQSLGAQHVTLDTLPPDLMKDWVASDGTTRIQVFPKSTSSDDATLQRFVDAVKKIAPDAIGGPVSILGSGKTIVNAFIKAGITSFVTILILLLIVLRRLRDVAATMIAIAWAAFVTLGTCVLLGLQLNFANIIALPLFVGIGVAFSIYYVIAWRAGQTHLLQSSLTRAVIFSALTTSSAFGSLWLSSHPGTASMGELLMISLGWTLVATLLFLNPLLGPPPAHKRRRS